MMVVNEKTLKKIYFKVLVTEFSTKGATSVKKKKKSKHTLSKRKFDHSKSLFWGEKTHTKSILFKFIYSIYSQGML